mgnify:CR=1 FL=1|jgi:hypothetical protein
MRLADLTVSELLALADILLKIAEDIPGSDGSAIREAVDEIKYILRLISEKTGAPQELYAASALN